MFHPGVSGSRFLLFPFSARLETHNRTPVFWPDVPAIEPRTSPPPPRPRNPGAQVYLGVRLASSVEDNITFVLHRGFAGPIAVLGVSTTEEEACNGTVRREALTSPDAGAPCRDLASSFGSRRIGFVPGPQALALARQ